MVLRFTQLSVALAATVSPTRGLIRAQRRRSMEKVKLITDAGHETLVHIGMDKDGSFPWMVLHGGQLFELVVKNETGEITSYTEVTSFYQTYQDEWGELQLQWSDIMTSSKLDPTEWIVLANNLALQVLKTPFSGSPWPGLPWPERGKNSFQSSYTITDNYIIRAWLSVVQQAFPSDWWDRLYHDADDAILPTQDRFGCADFYNSGDPELGVVSIFSHGNVMTKGLALPPALVIREGEVTFETPTLPKDVDREKILGYLRFFYEPKPFLANSRSDVRQAYERANKPEFWKHIKQYLENWYGQEEAAQILKNAERFMHQHTKNDDE